MAQLDGARIEPFARHTFVFEPAASDPMPFARAGTLTNDVTVIDVATRSHGGARAPAYGSEWFGRIHAVPGRHDFATVRDIERWPFELYNAAATDTTLEGITAEGDDGLTLLGPSTPEPIPARSSLNFEVEATLEGPPVIDARWTFDGTSTQALVIVLGERLVTRVWPLTPDWSQPIIERWQWNTDVQRAKGGPESRRPIYARPRRGLEFRILEIDPVRLDRLLSGWQSQRWVVPRWPDVARLTAGASAGDTQLAFDTSVGDWRVGGSAVLLGNPDPEAPAIASVDPGGVTLENPLHSDWPASATVYPGRDMRMPMSVDVERATAGLVTATVEFIADSDTETAYSADDANTTHNSLPVWLTEPNRANPAAASYARSGTRTDSGIGVILVDDPDGDPIHGHSWEYLFTDRSQADAFVRWLLAREGRHNAFYYPTWSVDLRVVQPIQADDPKITVRRIEWARWYQGRANRERIAIQRRDGTWYFAGVTGATVVGDEETLDLDQALVPAGDDPIQPAEVRRACWLERVRLGADRVELQWHTATAADAALSLVGVEP